MDKGSYVQVLMYSDLRYGRIAMYSGMVMIK